MSDAQTPSEAPAVSEGHVAVVTGAAGGIGLGIAKAAAARGMRVALADLDVDRANEAAALLAEVSDAPVSAHRCDVRDLDHVEALRDEVLGNHGRVDLVCLNAGVGLSRPLPACRASDWDLLVDVNLTGVTNGIRTFLPRLVEQGRGHLSATASLSGLVGDPDLGIYCATKFGVVGLMEALGHEMQRDHPSLSASVLCPGPVATDLIASSAKVLADGGSAVDQDDAVAEYLAAGLDPDTVGMIAIEGIAEGRFWLLPHEELTFDLLDERLAAMKRGELPRRDDVWTDQS